MDKYEQEIFKFLTQRSNFEAMLKVNSQFNFIKGELLREFWDSVAKNIALKIKENSEKWKIIDPPNKEHPKAKLIVFKDIWKGSEKHPFVGVAWQEMYTHPFLGVYSNVDYAALNSESLFTSLQEIKDKLNCEGSSPWWPLWQYGSSNFSVQSDLMNILPDRVDSVAEDYAENLLRLLHEVEGTIDKVLWG